ncbi:MAG: hydrogenase maturation protease [Anaerolineae bacterium]
MSDTAANGSRLPNMLIIGIGNPDRSDDGVGLAVARALAAKNLPNTTVVEARGDGATLGEVWKREDHVIIVDAMCSGAPPGAIRRFDAHEVQVPLDRFRCSSHTFGVGEAIELARSLNRLPAHMILVGIEGKNFDVGLGISRQVVIAARQVVAEIAREIRSAQPRRSRARTRSSAPVSV